MSRPDKLSKVEINAALDTLPKWEPVRDHHAISRKFEFKSFSEAFGFMTRAALVAEKLDHHPDWSNSYLRVDVLLTTHDVKGVTKLDIALATAMEKIAQS